jgi:hypothetical protein
MRKTLRAIPESFCALSALSLLLLLTATPSSAYAPVRLHILGRSVTPLYADGSRWAAYEPSAGTTTIIDSRTGLISSRPSPAGCAEEICASLDRGIGLLAVGSGELLYGCGEVFEREDTLRVVVESILTEVQQPVTAQLPIVSEVGAGGNIRIDAIGTQWMSGIVEGYRVVHRFFLNWHTDQLMADASEPASATQDFESLDAARLVLPLCRPVRRITNIQEFDYSQVRFTPFAYSPPFAVADVASIFANRTAASDDKPLRLMRCGSTGSMSLPGSGISLQLGSGILTWIALGRHNSPTMYETRLRRYGRRWHGAISPVLGPQKSSAGSEAQDWLPQHTATSIYQSVVPVSGPFDLIYAARMPR